MWIALTGFAAIVVAVVSLMLMVRWIIQETGISGTKEKAS